MSRAARAIQKAQRDGEASMEVLLPRPFERSPEHQLLAAVLSRAICDVLLLKHQTANAKSAADWLSSREHYTGSARWICDHLGISMRDVRQFIRRFGDRPRNVLDIVSRPAVIKHRTRRAS